LRGEIFFARRDFFCEERFFLRGEKNTQDWRQVSADIDNPESLLIFEDLTLDVGPELVQKVACPTVRYYQTTAAHQ
jgi:hypothetical protein